MKELFALFAFPCILGAQEALNISSDVFLFDRFTKGKILLTDKRYIETQFNYNCEKQELYYKDGNEYQMIYNTSNIDTLWIRGAMGVVSQAGGQASVDMELMRNRGISNPDNSVYKKDNRNTYRTCLDGQQVSFSNLKSFLKLYPDTHRKVIRQLVKEQSISFDDPWQVAKLIVLCQTI